MRRLRLMTTEKCSYRSSVSVSPSNSKSSTSSAFRVDRRQLDRELLAEEVGFVAPAVAIVGGDGLRLVDELCRLGARSGGGHPVLRARRGPRDRRPARRSRSAELSGWRRRRGAAGLTMLALPRLDGRTRAVGPPARRRPSRTSASSFFTTSARTA